MAIEKPPQRHIIEAEVVNALVHSYLKDSGFLHSAFCLNVEGRLDHSALKDTFIRRGQLVELLHKALVYSEVEAHWRNDSITMNCHSEFSLISDHTCSQEAAPTSLPLRAIAESISAEATEAADVPAPEAVPASAASTKRKASDTTVDDGRTDKRARTRTPVATPPPPAQSTSKPVAPASIPEEKVVKAQSAVQPRPPIASDSAPGGAQAPDPWAIRRLQGHQTEVFVCAWNPVQPHILASGDKAAMVNLWDVPTGPQDPWKTPAEILKPTKSTSVSKLEQADLTALNWSPDGEFLAVGSYDCELRILTAAGEIWFTHQQHNGPIFAARFSQNGRWLLTGSLDGSACVWDVREKKLVCMYRCHLDCCLDVEWIGEDTLATCGADKLINIMRVGEARPLKTLSGHTHEVNQVRFNETLQKLATCSDDRTARVWDISSIIKPKSPGIPGLNGAGPAPIILNGHKNNVSTVDWCPRQYEGQPWLLATSSFDGTARIWDTDAGTCLKTFADHRTPVFSIRFSPNGFFLATGGGDGHVHVYDMKTLQRVWSWSDPADPDKKKGIFEIGWQQNGGLDFMAMTLESQEVCVVDVQRIPQLRKVTNS